MPLEAKICGLKKKEDIILSINKGASYCGFITNIQNHIEILKVNLVWQN